MIFDDSSLFWSAPISITTWLHISPVLKNFSIKTRGGVLPRPASQDRNIVQKETRSYKPSTIDIEAKIVEKELVPYKA